ncbi:MAG: 2-oxo acid dehydrogenase subunit E2 [Fimbriimonadaceae bacterium]
MLLLHKLQSAGQRQVFPVPANDLPMFRSLDASAFSAVSNAGNQLVVPGMMSVVADWSGIEAVREEYKASGGDFQPSTFTIFAYAVAKACADHPIMRSTLRGDEAIRTYDNIQLGIVVARPGDELGCCCCS